VILHDPDRRDFASDNNAGIHPEVLAAIAEANGGHVLAYGGDPYTEKLQSVVKRQFGAQAEAFPVFNGTGANVLSLQALLPPWGAVICPDTAHINTDENGAPERVGHMKLLTVSAPHGKLTPELIAIHAKGFGDEHHVQPAAVSITQSTEVGTVYTADEIRAIADYAHGLGLYLHMDGTRLANAAAALGVSLRALTTDVGVDVVSLGGTKNGLLLADAIVVLNPDAVTGMKYLRKLNMQLASKMRFLSAQLIALFDGDLWLRSARHANAMAARLSAAIAELPGVTITQPTETNGVFAVLPAAATEHARKTFRFYDWRSERGEVRLMCAFDTTEEDVDRFVKELVAQDPDV
jgi:threonine aldolase